MTPYEVLETFAAQVSRVTDVKTVIAPTPLKDPGPIVKVKVRKVVSRGTAVQGRLSPERELRLTVTVDGKVESLAGLKAAVLACDAVASFLSTVTRLEDVDGVPVAGSRITETVNEEDGILEDPENGAVAWVSDDHFVTIKLPG